MTPECRFKTRGLSLLSRIGEDLDSDRQPIVFGGGVLRPATAVLRDSNLRDESTQEVSASGGEEQRVWQSPEAGVGTPAGTEGPEAGSRQRTPGEHSGAWGPPGSIASKQRESGLVESSDGITTRQQGGILSLGQQSDLAGALSVYRQLVVRQSPPGVWLTGSIRPLPELGEEATIILAYPCDESLPVRTWAWWSVGVWIGPRHTNLDGSACVYEPGDPFGGWRRGQPLIELLDMTSTWLARHLHLRYFGRWPGRQVLHTALERSDFMEPNELCGCGSSVRYADCHSAPDSAMTDQQIEKEQGGERLLLARARINSRQIPRTSREYEIAAGRTIPLRVPPPLLQS